jgi:hypothetical protein
MLLLPNWKPSEFEISVKTLLQWPAAARKLPVEMFIPELVHFPAPAGKRSLVARLADIMRQRELLGEADEPGEELVLHSAWALGLWLAAGDARCGMDFVFSQLEERHTIDLRLIFPTLLES